MFGDLFLIHRHGSAPAAFHTLASESYMGECLLWKTCLRQIAICSADSFEKLSVYLTPDDQVFEGAEAYRFLLQVICGLQSPLIGETEVSGQFKNAVTAFAIPVSPWGAQMRKLFQVLFEDAKRIRQHHLVDLGSQSYGSVIRREMKSVKEIHVIGAGHLVQEMLPWISKDSSKTGARIHIHCRNPEKAREVLSAQLGATPGSPQIELHGLDEQGGLLKHADALIVAAPVTAEWIREWLLHGGAELSRTGLHLIADTRGDSSEDSLSGVLQTSADFISNEVRMLTLAHLLEQISSNQAHVLARKEQALVAIDAAVAERGRAIEYRPFGWEDVCA